MRQWLINFIKYNDKAYDIFFYIGSFIIKILGLFIKIDDNAVLFVSFGGKKFDDSPKSIYDYMLNDSRCENMNYYWAFVEPHRFNILKGEKVKIDTFKFFITALKAKYWVTNSAVERGLSFKKKNTIYVNTWHGTPIKKICSDEHGKNTTSGMGSKDVTTIDLMTAQSEYDAKIFSRIFKVDSKKIKICDLPRNDYLSHYKCEDVVKIKKKLNIPLDKKVILYAPTYREYLRDVKNNCYITPPVDIKKWERLLGERYIILFRAHYEVVFSLGIEWSNFVRDMSNYTSLNDLMIISDMLISDYSSIFFDYSILERPMFCFAYDLSEYQEKRGLYFDLKEELTSTLNETEDDLLKSIITLDLCKAIDITKNFRRKYVPYVGNATKTVVDSMMGGKK